MKSPAGNIENHHKVFHALLFTKYVFSVLVRSVLFVWFPTFPIKKKWRDFYDEGGHALKMCISDMVLGEQHWCLVVVQHGWCALWWCLRRLWCRGGGGGGPLVVRARKARLTSV